MKNVHIPHPQWKFLLPVEQIISNSLRQGRLALTFQKSLTDTLPETNITPENGWLEYDPFLLGFGLFSGRVSFREGTTCIGLFKFYFRVPPIQPQETW